MAYPYYQPYQPAQMMQTPMQPIPQQAPPRPAMFVQPVAALEEARAVQTDFSGSMAIMPDIAHGIIYTKHWDAASGSAVFRAYRLIDTTPPERTEFDASQFVLRKDFDALVVKFNALLDQLGEVNKNDE